MPRARDMPIHLLVATAAKLAGISWLLQLAATGGGIVGLATARQNLLRLVRATCWPRTPKQQHTRVLVCTLGRPLLQEWGFLSQAAHYLERLKSGRCSQSELVTRALPEQAVPDQGTSKM